MNKYSWAVAIAMFGSVALWVALGLKYSQATLVFGLIAIVSAPVVNHRVPNSSIAHGLFIGLSIYASYPLRQLFQIEGFIPEVLVMIAYAAVLWVISAGWKRL